MDRNGIHVFNRVVGWAPLAGIVLGIVIRSWPLVIICGVLMLAIVAFEVVSFARRRREIRDRRG